MSFQVGKHVTLSYDKRMTKDLHGQSGIIDEIKSCTNALGQPYNRIIVKLNKPHCMKFVQFNEKDSIWMLEP